MSTVEQTAPGRTGVRLPSRLNLPEPTRVPFTRLTAVELRKQLNTRAGRWLLAAIGVVTAAIVAIMLFSGQADDGKNFGDFVAATVIPQSILLPILGVLAVTSEWSQRTGLVTFTLEPHRARVGWAKLVSAVLLGLATVVAALVLAALATFLCQAIRGSDPTWVEWKPLLGVLIGQLFVVLQGVAFGMILQNTPAAVVSYLVIPTLWTVVGSAVSWLHTASKWLDINQALQPVYDGTVHGDQWAKVAVAGAVWVLLPLLAGMWRLRRSEVK
ncbi:ABC transporter permease [Luteipulveratus sp. YIM 133132]|uniref:ABC transporter permease n=1 Tax=Luteipulveratus flavus TaxID=3031728 RepID=A0ABT6C5T2_9MICO|nr:MULTISPECIES: ABC transporter permease [unclassified Luteipulveratus]MDE9366424.1 ABC transporter permease [Luteipulveratus sp. YIM 133132]MDF8264301.1 ABC transporter permease [Luteipulveratus sp. YIM 133296]